MNWKSFVPCFREIDEEKQAALWAQKYGLDVPLNTGFKNTNGDESNASNETKLDSSEKTNEVSENDEIVQWEIRDEANRSWFRAIFDEYEYKPKNIKRQQFFSWFNKNDTREERILICKLDFLVCFYAFTMYWVKYLDQTNINNAYVSGMKEELNMKGNDLVHTQIVYTVCIFGIFFTCFNTDSYL